MFYSIREVDYHDLGKFRFHIGNVFIFCLYSFFEGKGPVSQQSGAKVSETI